MADRSRFLENGKPLTGLGPMHPADVRVDNVVFSDYLPILVRRDDKPGRLEILLQQKAFAAAYQKGLFLGSLFRNRLYLLRRLGLPCLPGNFALARLLYGSLFHDNPVRI